MGVIPSKPKMKLDVFERLVAADPVTAVTVFTDTYVDSPEMQLVYYYTDEVEKVCDKFELEEGKLNSLDFGYRIWDVREVLNTLAHMRACNFSGLIAVFNTYKGWYEERMKAVGQWTDVIKDYMKTVQDALDLVTIRAPSLERLFTFLLPPMEKLDNCARWFVVIVKSDFTDLNALAIVKRDVLSFLSLDRHAMSQFGLSAVDEKIVNAVEMHLAKWRELAALPYFADEGKQTEFLAEVKRAFLLSRQKNMMVSEGVFVMLQHRFMRKTQQFRSVLPEPRSCVLLATSHGKIEVHGQRPGSYRLSPGMVFTRVSFVIPGVVNIQASKESKQMADAVLSLLRSTPGIENRPFLFLKTLLPQVDAIRREALKSHESEQWYRNRFLDTFMAPQPVMYFPGEQYIEKKLLLGKRDFPVPRMFDWSLYVMTDAATPRLLEAGDSIGTRELLNKMQAQGYNHVILLDASCSVFDSKEKGAKEAAEKLIGPLVTRGFLGGSHEREKWEV